MSYRKYLCFSWCDLTYLDVIVCPEWQRGAHIKKSCSSCLAKGLLNKSEHVVDFTLLCHPGFRTLQQLTQGSDSGPSCRVPPLWQGWVFIRPQTPRSDINFKLQFNLFSAKPEKTLPFYDKNKRRKRKRAHRKEKGERF